MDAAALGPEATRDIMDHWSHFNKRVSLVAHMRDLFLTLLQLPVIARAEEYFVPFPGHLDKKSFLHIAEDGMLIYNHDFNESAELVCFNF